MGSRSMMAAGTPDWTDAEKATLTKMWLAGQSARQVATALGGGRTRSAVCGMIRRMKLPARPQRAVAPVTASSRPKPKTYRGLGMFGTGEPTAPAGRLLKGEVWCALPGTTPVPLVDLEPGMCKWPIGEGRPFLFCGSSAEGSYCATHAGMAVGAGTESERAAHRARETAPA